MKRTPFSSEATWKMSSPETASMNVVDVPGRRLPSLVLPSSPPEAGRERRRQPLRERSGRRPLGEAQATARCAVQAKAVAVRVTGCTYLSSPPTTLCARSGGR